MLISQHVRKFQYLSSIVPTLPHITKMCMYDMFNTSLQASLLSSASENVEQAFRNVDRGDYISGFPSTQVYGPDQTLRKTDNTYAHLSAPCIYAAVVEALDVQPGK